MKWRGRGSGPWTGEVKIKRTGQSTGDQAVSVEPQTPILVYGVCV